MTQKLILLVTLLVVGCARPTKAVDPILPVVEKGRQVYVKMCATCHGPGGNGYAADNAPSLRSPTFLAAATDTFLNAGITRGRPGTAMGAFGRELGGPLSPEDVNAVIAFLHEGAPPRASLEPAPVPGDAKRGKPLYDSICARCHGTPTQRSSAVHLANPVLLQTASDAFLRFAIVNGRPPTSMVPWKGALPAAQLEDVIAYVRSMAVAPGVPPTPPQLGMPPAPRTGPAVARCAPAQLSDTMPN